MPSIMIMLLRLLQITWILPVLATTTASPTPKATAEESQAPSQVGRQPRPPLKILVFSPAFSRSHIISNSRIAEALAEAGHNVTLLEVDWLIPNPNITTGKARRLRVPAFGASSLYSHAADKMTTTALTDASPIRMFWSNILADLPRVVGFTALNNQACALFLDANAELIERLREERYDAYFGEMLTLCGSGLSHLVGIRTHLWVSSTSLLEYMGWLLAAPLPVSYSPNIEVGHESEVVVGSGKYTYWRRAKALFQYVSVVGIFLRSISHTTQVFRERYGEDFPEVADIVRDSPLVFVSTHELVDFPRPTLPNIIHIGGLGMGITRGGDGEGMAGGNSTAAALIPEPFASEYFSKGRLGVVYFSLGTVVRTRLLPMPLVDNLLGAFAQLAPDFHFIVKVDAEDEERFANVLRSNSSFSATNNIYICSWAPQPALFAGGRVRAFITHGGYNSLMEAALNGIPLIGMGFFADQFRNAQLASRNGWGAAFDVKRLLHPGSGEAELLQLLKKVLYEESYQKAAKRISRLLRNSPTTAEERLVKSVELLMEHGGGRLPELQVEGRHLSLVVYYNLDIIVPFVLILLAATYLLARLVLTAAGLLWRCLLVGSDGGGKRSVFLSYSESRKKEKAA